MGSPILHAPPALASLADVRGDYSQKGSIPKHKADSQPGQLAASHFISDRETLTVFLHAPHYEEGGILQNGITGYADLALEFNRLTN